MGGRPIAILGPTTDRTEIQQWAERQSAVPVELLPHLVDGEPAILRFMQSGLTTGHLDYKVLTWSEFFLKFESLGLTFVYDAAGGPYNEILQAGLPLDPLHPGYNPES